MRFFRDLKKIGSGGVSVDVTIPINAHGEHRVRRFMGTYECGCPVDLELLNELSLAGRNPAEELFCEEHGTAMLYGPWQERSDMMNVAQVKEA